MRRHNLLALGVGLCLEPLFGCGRQTVTAPPVLPLSVRQQPSGSVSVPVTKPSQIFYVATDNGTIRQFGARPDGKLTPLAIPLARVAPSKTAITLALHPARRFAYAATVSYGIRKATIYPCRVNPSGSLAPIRAASVDLPGAIEKLLVDPKGRFLYAVGENGRIFTFQCLPDGLLSKDWIDNTVSGTFALDLMVGQRDDSFITLDPMGRYIFVYSMSGFVDHSERFLTTYRVLPGGIFREVKPQTQLEDAVWFDTAGKWGFVNADNDTVLMLRLKNDGSFSVVRKLTKQNGDFTITESDGKGAVRQTVPPFAVMLHLDTEHQTAVLLDEHGFVFTHVSLMGKISDVRRLVLPDAMSFSYGDQDRILNRDGQFLTTQFIQIQPGKGYFPPVLLFIAMGDKTNAPKVIQSVPLGGDTAIAVVSRPAN